MSSVGVDIAKATFDVALPLDNGKYRTRSKFANTPQGHAEFMAWLATHAPHAPVAMEATGTYHERLAEALVQRGVTVFVINPAQIAAYAKSELSRTKTDRTDAKLIARFCLAQQATQRPLRAFVPLSPGQRRLRALVQRREDLLEMRQMESNRREEADVSVHASIDLLLKTLDDQIAAAEKAIRQHINNDPDLRQRRDLVESIPGIGEATSAWLLACVGDTRQFIDVRQLVAFVGLNPRVRESGTWKGHTRISKAGSPQLRAKLYFPAIVASQHNPPIRAFYDTLIRRGKPPMVAVVAAMRKLLHMVWGVLRSGTPFNPKIALAG